MGDDSFLELIGSFLNYSIIIIQESLNVLLSLLALVLLFPHLLLSPVKASVDLGLVSSGCIHVAENALSVKLLNLGKEFLINCVNVDHFIFSDVKFF